MAKKKYDVVVWGATGFTGKWVAKHLQDHYQDGDVSWAIAGRSEAKLSETKEWLGDAEFALPHLVANSDDIDSLRAMAQQATTIISTVGPYAYYGANLVQACAEEGTHYVDLTGEVPWMREMIDAHSVAAEKSGARIVHSCGFDSIPSDMGVFYMQQEAQKRFGAPLANVQYALIKAKGGMSGGTAHSMLNILKQAASNKRVRRVLTNPYALNPDPSFKGPDKMDQSSVKWNEKVDRWTAPFLMAGINTRIVRRSNALMGFAYGDEFSYQETMATGKGASGYAAALGISSALKSMTLMGITGVGRKVLEKILPSQGEGPVVDPENPGFYIIQFDGETAAGETLTGRLYGDGDPGYGSTSKKLAESGICLGSKDVKTAGGFWTPASAMGEALLERLMGKGGLKFELIEK